jgi:hypothetical protein
MTGKQVDLRGRVDLAINGHIALLTSGLRTSLDGVGRQASHGRGIVVVVVVAVVASVVVATIVTTIVVVASVVVVVVVAVASKITTEPVATIVVTAEPITSVEVASIDVLSPVQGPQRPKMVGAGSLGNHGQTQKGRQRRLHQHGGRREVGCSGCPGVSRESRC